MTWRDDIAEVGPSVRAGWEILDGLRSIAFTGSARFPLMPVATVYLDRGRIYYAERSGDADVADRVVAAGCLRPSDLATGVIEVYEEPHGQRIDNLGRLFDRVPTLDRARVMLALELITEETVAWVARQSVTDSTTEPYEHHPSGVHRWYEPLHTISGPCIAQPSRPVADRQHTPEDLPQVRVAWSDPEPGPSFPPPPPPPSSSASDPQPPLPRRPRSAEKMSSARSRWETVAARTERAEPHETDVEIQADFAVLWPSGDGDIPLEPPPMVAPTLEVDSDRFDAVRDAGDWMVDFDALSDVDQDAEEVSLAVRRAIAAVETGRARPAIFATEPFDPLGERSTGSPRSRTASRRPGSATRGVSDESDDPFDRPSSARSTPMSDDERRTALQRLIDAMRGR